MTKFIKSIKAVSAVICATAMLLPNAATAYAATSANSSNSDFKLVSKSYSDVYDGNVLVYSHKKTGAKVVFIQNDDNDKGFSIAFHTPSEDNTGVAHIIEHSVVCGSKELRSNSLFFDMRSDGYLTDANATTASDSTLYYFSTLNEKQLYGYMDVTLDCCFDSAFLYDKNYFYREGWHYELDNYSTKSPLEANGIVYSEMKGYDQPTETLMSETNKLIFKGTGLENYSGGNPDNITDLTYEQAVNFYNNYYTPSNSTALVYGNANVSKSLSLLDKYYDKFSVRKGTDVESDKELDIKTGSCVLANRTYPYSFSTDGANYLCYAFAMPESIVNGDFTKNLAALDMMSSYLNNPNMPLMKNLYASGLATSFYAEVSTMDGWPTIYFLAGDSVKNGAAKFKKIVDKSLDEISSEGLDKETINGYLKQFDYECDIDSADFGVNPDNKFAALNLLFAASAYEDTELFDYTSDYSKLTASYIEDCFKNYVITSKSKSLISLTPEIGGIEREEKEQLAKLAKIKKNMTNAELKQVIKTQKDIETINEIKPSDKTIQKLSVVKADDINYNEKIYATGSSTISNGKLYTAYVDDADAVYTEIEFDLSDMSFEEIYYLSEYLNMIGFGTESSSSSEISSKVNKYFYNSSLAISSKVGESNFVPVLSIGYYTRKEYYKEALELMLDMGLNTKLEGNENYIKTNAANLYSYYFSESNIMNRMELDSKSDLIQTYAFYSDFYGKKGEKCAQKIYKQSVSDMTGLISKMESVRKKAVKTAGISVTLIGSKNDISDCKLILNKALKKLPVGVSTPTSYKLKNGDDRVRSYIYDYSTVDNIYINYPLYSSAGISEGAAATANCLLTSKYFLPEIRFSHGAYSVYAGYSNGWMTWVSYSDPDFTDTLNIFKGAGDFLRSGKYDKNDVETAKIAAISRYTIPSNSYDTAYNQLIFSIYDMDKNYNEKIVKEIKATDIEQIKDFAAVADQIYTYGDIFVMTTSQKSDENDEIFDAVID